jgi:hypothetical protein
VKLSPLGTAATTGILYQPTWQIMVTVEQLMEWRLARKQKYSEKTCLSVTLSTTNPTWSDPGHRAGKPATDRPSYGSAYIPRTQSLNCTYILPVPHLRMLKKPRVIPHQFYFNFLNNIRKTTIILIFSLKNGHFFPLYNNIIIYLIIYLFTNQLIVIHAAEICKSWMRQ